MKKLNIYITEKFKIQNKKYEESDIFYKTTLNIVNNYLDNNVTLDDIEKYIKDKNSIFTRSIYIIYNWLKDNSITNIKAYSTKDILDKADNSKKKNFIIDDYTFSKYLDEVYLSSPKNKYLVFNEGQAIGIKIYIKDNILIYQVFANSYTDSSIYTYIFIKDE